MRTSERLPLPKGGTPILVMAATWALFVFSAKNYSHLTWHPFLLSSRILLALVGIALGSSIQFARFPAKQWPAYYFLASLLNQSIHGYLEGPSSIEFTSFTGPLFILLGISHRGNFKSWLKIFFPVATFAVALVIASKENTLTIPVSRLIDNFSLPIVGCFVGLIVAKANSDRWRTAELLIEAKDAALMAETASRETVEREVNALRSKIEAESRFYAIGSIAAQVSHDIRSPLAALNAILHSADNMDADQRSALQSVSKRIREIANQLLSIRAGEALTDSGFQNHKNQGLESEPIIPWVQCALEDTRSGISSKKIRFSMDFSGQTACSCAVFNPIQLYRVVSNILGNAIDASDDGGHISIVFESSATFIRIKIQDNGRGIPPEILPRLGVQGFTHAKPNGNGLGIFHAKETMKSWGGSIQIESELSRGTSVILSLPISPTPDWLSPEFKIDERSRIAILDDDSDVSVAWRSISSRRQDISLLTFEKPNEFSTWHATIDDRSNLRLFIDLELGAAKESGLDLIQRMNLQSVATLVTNKWDEPSVRTRALNSGVRILPKPILFAAAYSSNLTRA